MGAGVQDGPVATSPPLRDDSLRAALAEAFRWFDPGAHSDHLVSDVSGWWHSPELLASVGPALADLFADAAPTLVVSPEVTGFLVGPLVAVALGVGFAPAVKDGSDRRLVDRGHLGPHAARLPGSRAAAGRAGPADPRHRPGARGRRLGGHRRAGPGPLRRGRAARRDGGRLRGDRERRPAAAGRGPAAAVAVDGGRPQLVVREPGGGVAGQRPIEAQRGDLVQRRVVVDGEPADLERLVVVDRRVRGQRPAGEGDVEVLAHVAVGVPHHRADGHRGDPLGRHAYAGLLEDLPHDRGGRLLTRLRDAGDQGPAPGVGPPPQQDLAGRVLDHGADAGQPERRVPDVGADVGYEARSRHGTTLGERWRS